MAEKIWLSSPHMSDEGYEMEYIWIKKSVFSKTCYVDLGQANKKRRKLNCDIYQNIRTTEKGITIL